LEAAGRSPFQDEVVRLARHGEAERRRLGRTAARHLDRQGSANGEARLHEKVVGRGSDLPCAAAVGLHLDLGILRRGQRRRFGEVAQHRDGGVERMGALDGGQGYAVLRPLGEGHRGLHLRPERHGGGENPGAQHAADRAGRDQFARFPHDRVAAHLQPDRDMHARGARGFRQFLRFGAVAPEWIFAIDVLARGDRPEQQVAMGRDVHRHRDDVDVRIGEELFEVAIAGSRPEGFRGLFGGGLVSRRDGAEVEPREPLHGRHVRDLRPTPLGARPDDPDL